MARKDEATQKVVGHVERAQKVLVEFRNDAVTPDGILARPRMQLAELKIAREDLEKAIGIIERTKW